MHTVENEINTLDELNKGACMGKDAVLFILDKVTNPTMKNDLHDLLNKYDIILEEIAKVYPKYSWDEPHKTSAMNKVMTWYGIEMKTFMDVSSSKIAEILLQGLNMGVIEGRRLLNHKDVDKKTQLILHKYVHMQEEAVETFKGYL